MNKTIIIGNIGNDAEVRTLDSGTIAISFSVGVSESYVNKQGEKVSNTTWFNCTKWVQPGQSTKIAEYLTKGNKVAVEGKITARGFIKGDNTAGASLELNVREIELVGSKQTTATPEVSNNAYNTGTPAPEQFTPFTGNFNPMQDEDGSDGLPFN
jgi:single-strand DNA-binding protein